MAQFQSTREQTEQKVVLHMLTEIASNPTVKQRTLAAELGIAVGLMNTYIKRCVTKGWVRVSQISPKRITYFLTPEGLKEKGRMVKDYLASSLTFFRDARSQSELLFAQCEQKNWTKIALVGIGDLADIVKLVGNSTKVQVEIATIVDDLSNYDAVIITDIQHPQETFDFLKTSIEPHRLLTLDLLHILRNPIESENI